MIVRTRGGDRELRSGTIGSSVIPAPGFGSWRPSSGEPITVARATALPAVFNAIRLVAETTGRLPLRVYSGFQAEKRTREDTWQWDLLHHRPNPERSAFDFWQDVAACIETTGDAFAFKAKSRRRVEALFLIHPACVQVKRDRESKELRYVVTRGRERAEFMRSEILHIRGLTTDGGDRGISPLDSEAIGSGLSRYEHEGSLYRNHASIPYALKFEGKMDRQQAAQALAVWKSTHSGGNDSGNPGVLAGGAGIENLGITMEQAQFIESHEFSVKDIARIYNLPASLLNGMDTQPTEEESRRLLNFGLAPRLKRISEAVYCDPDIFPPGEDLYPEHYTDEFVRPDAKAMAEIYHKLTQVGLLLPDEGRAELGRPPLPKGAGQIPQITPVGGAPNPAAVTNGASAE